MESRSVTGIHGLSHQQRQLFDVWNASKSIFTFHIDDEVREDVVFSYEQIAESRFEIESFGLDSEEDYSFVDLDEYSEANFPEVLEVEQEEELPKYKKKEDEDPEKIEKEEKKKADEENKELPELKDSDNKYYK